MKKFYIKEKAALDKVADAHNTSVEEVRKEITKAIDIGMASTDPVAQAFWSQIPYKGDKPSPEEFIAFVAEKVKGKIR